MPKMSDTEYAAARAAIMKEWDGLPGMTAALLADLKAQRDALNAPPVDPPTPLPIPRTEARPSTREESHAEKLARYTSQTLLSNAGLTHAQAAKRAEAALWQEEKASMLAAIEALPVPWAVDDSYRPGADETPEQMRDRLFGTPEQRSAAETEANKDAIAASAKRLAQREIDDEARGAAQMKAARLAQTRQGLMDTHGLTREQADEYIASHHLDDPVVTGPVQSRGLIRDTFAKGS